MKKFIYFVSVLALLLSLSFSVKNTALGRNSIEIDFYFEKGWNLVSGLYRPDQLSGGAIASRDILAIFTFVPETQQYVRLYPKPEMEKLKVMGDYDDRLDYMAQWVYSIKQGAAEYMIEREEISLGQWEVLPGWNFIGLVFPEMLGKHPNEIRGSCRWTKAYTWASEGGRTQWINVSTDWETDEPISEQHIGLGFVIKVPAACKLGIEATVPSLPSLPE